MNGAPSDDSPEEPRRRAAIRHWLIWPAWLLLSTGSVFWPWSTSFTIATSGIALACAVLLHRFRHDAGHAFVLAQAILMAGSAGVLLTALAFTRPVFEFLERTLMKFFMEFFHDFGAFSVVYVIACVVLMAFILASQRDR